MGWMPLDPRSPLLRLGERPVHDKWIDEGRSAFPEVYGEELEMLARLRGGRGFRSSSSYSVSEIAILADWILSPPSLPCQRHTCEAAEMHTPEQADQINCGRARIESC
jgi:hypothetical protein